MLHPGIEVFNNLVCVERPIRSCRSGNGGRHQGGVGAVPIRIFQIFGKGHDVFRPLVDPVIVDKVWHWHFRLHERRTSFIRRRLGQCGCRFRINRRLYQLAGRHTVDSADHIALIGHTGGGPVGVLAGHGRLHDGGLDQAAGIDILIHPAVGLHAECIMKLRRHAEQHKGPLVGRYDIGCLRRRRCSADIGSGGRILMGINNKTVNIPLSARPAPLKRDIRRSVALQSVVNCRPVGRHGRRNNCRGNTVIAGIKVLDGPGDILHRHAVDQGTGWGSVLDKNGPVRGGINTCCPRRRAAPDDSRVTSGVKPQIPQIVRGSRLHHKNSPLPVCQIPGIASQGESLGSDGISQQYPFVGGVNIRVAIADPGGPVIVEVPLV